MPHDLPLFVLAVTVCAYWGTVTLLVLVRRLRDGQRAGVVPRQRFERRLWLVIMPVVAAWVAFPLLAANSRSSWLAPPSWATQPGGVALALRGAAAGVAAACYLASVYCWLLLGRSWTMAVVPKQSTRLVTEGIYRWVRHPIYSLSMALMIASAVVLPSPPMVLLAGTHLLVLRLKALNEEGHLTERFGEEYTRYCGQVGRFWPSGLLRRSA